MYVLSSKHYPVEETQWRAISVVWAIWRALIKQICNVQLGSGWQAVERRGESGDWESRFSGIVFGIRQGKQARMRGQRKGRSHRELYVVESRCMHYHNVLHHITDQS